MGAWNWFTDNADLFMGELRHNANQGRVANPFVVKESELTSMYRAGACFGDMSGSPPVQHTSTEIWASSTPSTVLVGGDSTASGVPADTLCAMLNGLLSYVPAGTTRSLPNPDSLAGIARTVTGPAYVIEMLDPASHSLWNELNSDTWTIADGNPGGRPRPTVVVYENVQVDDDTLDLIRVLYAADKKPPIWSGQNLDALVDSWLMGESSVLVMAGCPIGFPASDPPPGAVTPPGLETGWRCLRLTVFDEFLCPIDPVWLIRHTARYAELKSDLVLLSPDSAIFTRSELRNAIPARDVIDLRDEYNRPLPHAGFKLLDEEPDIVSVFDVERARQLINDTPLATGPEGIWTGPTLEPSEISSEHVLTRGLGIPDHLLAFLPSCPSSSLAIRLRGYAGDYYRLCAFPLQKWYPEQPNARPEHAPQRYHLGCRATPLIDGQNGLAVMADAIRATYERGPDDPIDNLNLRPEVDRQSSFVYLANWSLNPNLFPYGSTSSMRGTTNEAECLDGTRGYPVNSILFFLVRAITAGVEVRALAWANIMSIDDRGSNREAVRALNWYYDFNAYHGAGGGTGADDERGRVDVGGMESIPTHVKRGQACRDPLTRGAGAHHQKAAVVRNRYGDFAFVGGIDLNYGRWDTQRHRDPADDERGNTKGWHDVHVMLEGPIVGDVIKNFHQRWNAYLTSAPPDASGDPVDLTGIDPFAEMPVTVNAVADWNGPVIRRPEDQDMSPHANLEAGPDDRRPSKATHIVSICRTIPPFIDGYNGFVKARDDELGGPLGELGCLASFRNAIGHARRYVYIEDQYFIHPALIDLLIERLTHPQPEERLKRLFVIIPHILADDPINDTIYHHYRRDGISRIQDAVRQMIASDLGMTPENVPQDAIDQVFVAAHLQRLSSSELYVHAKHMIVDDLWMVITSSNLSRRGMSFETEIGACISDAAIEDGARKCVRDQRIRLWSEHLRLLRKDWHKIVDPAAGLDMLADARFRPDLPLIPFQFDNPYLSFNFDPEQYAGELELVYNFICDPDGEHREDSVDWQTAEAAYELLKELKG
jgi:phosphatidylserine/phosphatidylglycerophosphate/cardiolipin synthase-like enzyme